MLGETRLPHRLQHKGSNVGGLSGMDYDPASSTYYLLSNDGGSFSPPRFYTARIALKVDKLSEIELTGVTFLQGLSAPDPEAIRWHAPSQSLLWTSEGNAVRFFIAPALYQTRMDGALLRTYPLPAMFDFGALTGSRINKTLDALAIAPNGQTARGRWKQRCGKTEKSQGLAATAGRVALHKLISPVAKPCGKSPTCQTLCPARPRRPVPMPTTRWSRF